MSATSDRLLDTIRAEREIVRTLHRYCHAIDRLDADELRSVYHPGAIDDHGSYRGSAEGFIAGILPRLRQTYAATQHSLSNISIDIHGDTAFVESYVMASHVIAVDLGGGLFIFNGRYVDRFEDRGTGWRIAHRRLLRTWTGVQPLARSLEGRGYVLADPSPHTDGIRSADDPSYLRS